jgi:ribosomal protein L24
MKKGDIAIKAQGHEKGKIGIVLEVKSNTAGNTLVKVLCEGTVRSWYSKYVEVVKNESDKN